MSTSGHVDEIDDGSHHIAKKVKFETEVSLAVEDNPCPSTSHDVTIRMNSHIHLCFHLPTLTLPYHTIPSFTHQLFENEEMTFSSEYAKQIRIQIDINCLNLQHHVNILHIADVKKQQECWGLLKKGVPNDTVVTYDQHHLGVKVEEWNRLGFPTTTTEGEEAFLGKTLNTFTRDDMSFLITHCTSNDAKAALILQRFEKLAMWFIETADSVDFLNNPQWELLLLYQHLKPTNTFALVGYVTLYTFHTPMCGSRLRICQVLVLPPFQSKGLGRELILEVYKLAQERLDIIEVTVEDPCVGFQRLREVVDVEWVLHEDSKEEEGKTAALLPKEALKERIEQILNQDEEILGNEKKIIKSQAMFVKEALQYLQLVLGIMEDQSQAKAQETTTAEGEEEQPIATRLKRLHHAVETHVSFGDFRLKVKRNLLKVNKELKYLEKPAMQKELSRLFEENMHKYHHVLRAMYRLELLPSWK